MTGGDENEVLAAAEEPAAKRARRRLFPVLGPLVVLILFAAAVWYAYRLGVEAGSDGDVPLIAAEPGPTKIKPTNPGGLEVPHQDVTVYQRFAQQPAKPVQEQLLPGPEQPLPKPPPLPSEPASAAEPSQPAAPGGGAVPPPAGRDPGSTGSVSQPPKTEAPPAPPGSQPVPQPPTAAAVPPAPVAPTPAPQPAPSPPPPGNAPAVGGYRVQLASLRSESEARDAWNRLKSAHPDLLGRLQLRLERVDLGGGKGVYHRVQAGPLSEKALADMVCGELRTRNVGCIVVHP